MRTFRRYKIWIFALFFALSFLIFLPNRTTALAAEDVASVKGTSYATLSEALKHWTDNTTLTLLKDCVTQETITVDGIKTLDLGGHTLSLAAGKTGSVLRVEDTLTLRGDGEIKGGSSVRGGGIYVAGQLSLRGNVIVANNTDSNIYLTRGNKIDAEGFTGRAGVTVLSVDEPFATGTTGTFFSDNLVYRVGQNNGIWRLYLSPLASIKAELKEGSPRIFPKTKLDDLKKYLTVTGTNENGVAYPVAISYTLSGELTLGDCTISVIVDENIFTEVTVNVVAPQLVSIEAKYTQTGTFYFDSNPELLYSDDLEVKGYYEDGCTHRIFPDSERTAESCGEDYIRDSYQIECDFTRHQSGKVTATVTAAEKTANFEVNISKHIVNTAGLKVVDVTVMEGANVTPDSSEFIPGLVKSIMPVVTRNGLALNAENLTAGVYTVEISFVILDKENYELVGENLKGRLIVNRSEFTKTGDKLSYVITREGGISPEWDFLVTETKDNTVLGDEYEVRTAYEISFLPGESSANPGEFTIKILLPDYLRSEEIKLFRLRADGEPVEVESEREGDYLVFKASNLVQTRFLLSTESSTKAYVILAICFGVVSVLGAGALIWYFFFKRKLHKDEY